MTDNPAKKKSCNDPDWPLAEDGNPAINIIIPMAFQSDIEGEYWRPGTPIRLFSQLANDHFFKLPTLTRKQLAKLVDHFKDEPLPASLRAALTAELNGKRNRKQGRKHLRQSALERVEQIMLPAAYDEAMKDAVEERKRLKLEAKNHPRRAPMAKIPTRRSIALDLVRKRLPTVADISDPRLTNLVSEIRTLLSDGDSPDAGEAPETRSE